MQRGRVIHVAEPRYTSDPKQIFAHWSITDFPSTFRLSGRSTILVTIKRLLTFVTTTAQSSLCHVTEGRRDWNTGIHPPRRGSYMYMTAFHSMAGVIASFTLGTVLPYAEFWD